MTVVHGLFEFCADRRRYEDHLLIREKQKQGAVLAFHGLAQLGDLVAELVFARKKIDEAVCHGEQVAAFACRLHLLSHDLFI